MYKIPLSPCSRFLCSEKAFNICQIASGVSRFLREIPQELLQEIRVSGRGQLQFSAAPTSSGSSSLLSDTPGVDGLAMGQRVRHGKYGEGVVLQFEGAGERAKVQVNFSDGAKWLMVSYANLQILDT